jgi:outer membrane protein TolC
MTSVGHKCSDPWQIRAILFLVLAAVLLAGCTTAQYRKSADKDAYGIVQDVEAQLFGHTNTFTIDTSYSARKPAEIAAPELIEDRCQTNREILTLERALDLAATRSRRYQAAKENLYLTALTLTGQRHAFSPQFFASSSGSFTRTSSGEKFVSIVNKVGVSEFLKTGGALSVSLANDILRYYTGEPRRSVISLVTVNVAQPLMRGFGRNNPAVESLTQAERNVVYAVRNYSFFQDQFALEITNDYFGLLGQKDIIRNRYTNYLGRVQSTRRLEARAHDRERLQDVDQARQAELTAKDNYVNAVATHRNALDQFKIKLGLALGDQLVLDDRALDELAATGPVSMPLNPDQGYRFAVENHSQILNAIDRFEDSKRKVRVAADQLRADVKLFGNAALASDPPTDYTHFDPDKVVASVGLDVNLPIDRLLERNAYRATLVGFEAELRNFTLTLDSLKDSILRGMRTLDQRRENYQIQTNALTLANRRVASATMLLEAGRAEVRDLVEAQDAQISAENAVTAALVDYQQTRLQLLLDIGALQTATPQFWLKDPLRPPLRAEASLPSQSSETDREVPPPEHYFDN